MRESLTASSPRCDDASQAMQLSIHPSAFASVVEATVIKTWQAILADMDRLGDRLAFSEAEAARLLSLKQHQLRDCRLRGEIGASIGPCRKILYRREDLLAYLARNRSEARI